jgi:phenylalanyl-tRNA synthetase alpha chain
MQLSLSQIASLREQLDLAAAHARTRDGLEHFRREWLSKDGKLRSLFKDLKALAPDERVTIAAALNELKDRAEEIAAQSDAACVAEERTAALSREFFDLSLPAKFVGLGAPHPITRVERQIAELLRQCGFVNAEGPIVETDYYCFDALNIPKHHPARDMQDTFYTESGHVLRTHTTSVQARLLERAELPLRAMSFGQVYRNEAEDASHTSMFHQFELVWVEEGLTLAQLMGLMSYLLRELYGKRRKIRFVPKFYPYTEPSIGAQVECGLCKGGGCSACGHSGWATVAGAGMIHRNVLLEFKHDPEKITGFAFGFGTSRLAAQICGYEDLRRVYENDLRVLKGV